MRKQDRAGNGEPLVAHFITWYLCLCNLGSGYVLLCIAHKAVCFSSLNYICGIVQNCCRNTRAGTVDFIATYYTSFGGRCGAHWWMWCPWKLVIVENASCLRHNHVHRKRHQLAEIYWSHFPQCCSKKICDFLLVCSEKTTKTILKLSNNIPAVYQQNVLVELRRQIKRWKDKIFIN